MSTATAMEVCTRSLAIMAEGTLADFAQVIHPDAINREADAEPPACRTRGPAAFLASANWLRSAFADLSWSIEDIAGSGDLVAMRTTMSGRQVGTFVTYDADGHAAQAMPSRGRSFAVHQTHWLRLADGLIVEHWADRDDLGLAVACGWVPPSPAYLIRMAVHLRRARRQPLIGGRT
jgi:predicted ester cyclase